MINVSLYYPDNLNQQSIVVPGSCFARAASGWKTTLVKWIVYSNLCPTRLARPQSVGPAGYHSQTAYDAGGYSGRATQLQRPGSLTRDGSAYIDFLENAYLIRRLPPYFVNIGKRLVKVPKVFVRDSGLAHLLMGIDTFNALTGSLLLGGSWEGYVVQQVFRSWPH